MSNWAKQSVGLITFAFINLVLFIALSSPINTAFEAIEREASIYSGTPPHPYTYSQYDNTSVYYYSAYSGSGWQTNPNQMTDNNLVTYANCTFGDTRFQQNLTTNNASSTIPLFFSLIYLRVYGSECGGSITLHPIFDGTTEGQNYSVDINSCSQGWSSWIDITNDTFYPNNNWTYDDINMMDVRINGTCASHGSYCNCSKVEIFAYQNETLINDYLQSLIRNWEETYSYLPYRDQWYLEHRDEYPYNPKTNMIPIFDMLRTVFGMMFVLSMIGLAVWFFLFSHKDEYESTVNEDYKQWRGF